MNSINLGTNVNVSNGSGNIERIKSKLFTNEDPGIHKYSGIFVLCHFAYRFYQSYFGDLTGNLGKNSTLILSLLCIIPHMILSLSSLIFHTVPRERVVGKPMIWQEFRMHNIIFGMRSIICTVFAMLATHYEHLRKALMISCALSGLVANAGADYATTTLRDNEYESTTATMPYWSGCSVETQKRFKSFYACK